MKNSKRKLLLSFTMLFSVLINAQMVVSAPVLETQIALLNGHASSNVAKNTTLVTKAISSLKTLNDMKATYDEWTDAIVQINNAISTGKEVINIAHVVGEIGQDYVLIIDYIFSQADFSDVQVQKYVTLFTAILNKSITNLESTVDVTTEGVFKMKDSARLSFIKNIEKEVVYCKQLMIYAFKKVKHLQKKKKSKEKIKEFLNPSSSQSNGF